MAQFPALSPSAAPITFGAVPVTTTSSLNGSESRIRHGTAEIGRRLRLTFENVSESDFLAVLSHYREQRGGFDSFGFSTTTLAAALTPSGYAWLYASPPQVVDEHTNVFTVVCEFKAEPRGLVVAPGDAWRSFFSTFTPGARNNGIVSAAGVPWVTSSTRFGPGPTGWIPLALSPSLWLDFGNPFSVTSSSGKITQIDDKSGNARHATQSYAPRQPLYTTAGVNGRNCMECTNGDQWVEIAATLNVQCFVIVHQNAGGWFIVGDSSSFDFHGTPGSYWFDGTYASSRILSGSAWLNGASIAPRDAEKQPTTTVYIFNTTDNVRISQFSADRGNGYGARSANGKTCEILGFSSNLGTSDRQKLEGYLAHRWGFAASLPSGHPYLSAPPT
jgi:hypothetical protein